MLATFGVNILSCRLQLADLRLADLLLAFRSEPAGPLYD
jgi:hypothetical protein